ncbi:MAG TPA: hypothetical protein VN789_06655 [Casimicrobiaceae bacterium]|jgi:hypothetical protein|nr:hypothetical protein [Casimicrobiaceae bacterium]
MANDIIATGTDIGGVIERLITDVPAPRDTARATAPASADAIMRAAARRAALVSGSLALPPGPLGVATVLPDLYLIWKIQRQMVADLFAVHGRTGELTRTHMLYCLFRHAASQVLRDVAVRAGERVVVREMTAGALRGALSTLGVTVTQRVAGATAGRFVPALGAAAVAGYAYWDTLQVAKSAHRLLVPPAN